MSVITQSNARLAFETCIALPVLVLEGQMRNLNSICPDSTQSNARLAFETCIALPVLVLGGQMRNLNSICPDSTQSNAWHAFETCIALPVLVLEGQMRNLIRKDVVQHGEVFNTWQNYYNGGA